MKNGQGFTIKPRLTLEWPNPDITKNFILDHGESVTVVYKYIVIEDDLSKRSLPEGLNYPVSRSATAEPECAVFPGLCIFGLLFPGFSWFG